MSSRTLNASRNLAVAVVCQIINLVLNFVSRTAFVKFLGVEYLGVNGLFTNILSILAFAELGIGNAIIFSLYKPLSENNQTEICGLLSLYKRTYYVICFVIFIFGLIVIPFLDLVVKEKPQINENLIFIYFLFIISTISSYLFVYKKSLLIADQKNYIVLIITEIFHVIQLLLQIIVLFAWHDFVTFLLIQIICNIATNVCCSMYVNKKYTWVKRDEIRLPLAKKKEIFKNITAMALYKFGSIFLNSSSNIIISAMVNLTAVGIVSNYILLHQACNSIIGKITDAFSASIGNLNVTADPTRKREIFNCILLIVVWAYGLASVGIIAMSDYLIHNWLGDFYVLDITVVIAIIAGFYVQGVHALQSTYRTTMGFFVKGKYSPLAAAILNIILSVILCKMYGLIGVFIATPIARFMTIGLTDTYIIYHFGFNYQPLDYIVRSIKYLIIISFSCVVCRIIVISYVPNSWIGVFSSIAIVAIVYNTTMFVTQYKTKEYKELAKIAKNLVLNRRYESKLQY